MYAIQVVIVIFCMSWADNKINAYQTIIIAAHDQVKITTEMRIYLIDWFWLIFFISSSLTSTEQKFITNYKILNFVQMTLSSTFW